MIMAVDIPFQGAPSSVPLRGESAGGLILCFRAVEARRLCCNQLTQAVSRKGRNWWSEGLAEVIRHAAESVSPAVTKTC